MRFAFTSISYSTTSYHLQLRNTGERDAPRPMLLQSSPNGNDFRRGCNSTSSTPCSVILYWCHPPPDGSSESLVHSWTSLSGHLDDPHSDIAKDKPGLT